MNHAGDRSASRADPCCYSEIRSIRVPAVHELSSSTTTCRAARSHQLERGYRGLHGKNTDKPCSVGNGCRSSQRDRSLLFNNKQPERRRADGDCRTIGADPCCCGVIRGIRVPAILDPAAHSAACRSARSLRPEHGDNGLHRKAPISRAMDPRSAANCDPPDPPHQQWLQRQSDPQPGDVPDRRIRGPCLIQHVDVRRQNGRQQGNQSPRGSNTRGRNEQSDRTSDFENAANVRSQTRVRHPWWHDAIEDARHHEVQDAGAEENHCRTEYGPRDHARGAQGFIAPALRTRARRSNGRGCRPSRTGARPGASRRDDGRHRKSRRRCSTAHRLPRASTPPTPSTPSAA